MWQRFGTKGLGKCLVPNRKKEINMRFRSKMPGRRVAVLLACTAIFSVQPAPLLSFARDAAATEYDAGTLAKLADDTLEYGEIAGLIEQYNVTYKNQLASFYENPDGSTGLTKDQLLGLAAELRAEADTLDTEAEDGKDDKELTDAEYQAYRTNVRELRSYAKALEDSAAGKSAAGTSALRSLRVTRQKQTRSAASMMRAYERLADQEAIAQKSVELAKLYAESAEKQQALGLAAAEDVLSAKESLKQAEASLASAKKSMASQKQTLLTTLGWSYDADPTITRVPEPDLSRITEMNLSADTDTALEHNYKLYDLRTTDSASQGGANEKARLIKDQENAVRENLETLYQAVLQSRSSYQAAETNHTSAKNTRAANERRYAMGMLSRQEYLQAEITYLTAWAEFDQAGLSLTAAIEDYEWALTGLMDSDSASAAQ